MKFLKVLLLVMFSLTLTACLDDLFDDGSSDDSYSDNDSGSGGGGGSGGGSYDYSYTCPGGYGSEHTVPIPRGSCESQYKNYARIFGCNDVDNFNSAACTLESCTGGSWGCGAYQ